MGTREVYEEKLRTGNVYHHDPTINPGLGTPRCPRCLSLLDSDSKNGEWTITSVLHDATAVPLNQLPPPNVKRELIMLSLPAIASQAIDPMAQLMETAYIGSLGPVQLASAGVSMSIFNIISKLFNIPLLSVATSFVAEDLAKSSSGFSYASTSREVSVA
ncbi:uncharacterized protein [Spinacia oleracea]|uniref:Protein DETOXIFICATION n=1 Tax=Spinacia oleracea TaxID=3562 RepID=A0ABM3QYD3_SPIOL|nr:uncharacterized protein LOC130463291 [Spinacia oleracea]